MPMDLSMSFELKPPGKEEVTGTVILAVNPLDLKKVKVKAMTVCDDGNERTIGQTEIQIDENFEKLMKALGFARRE